jgi:hypothetical protein
MGIRGPKPKPNARRRGGRVAISTTHVKICDRIRTKGKSRADIVELALEYLEEYFEKLGTLPPQDK